MRLQSQRQGTVLDLLALRSRKRGGLAHRLNLLQRREGRLPQLVPCWQRRAVFSVYDGDAGRVGAPKIFETKGERFRRAGLFRQEKIPCSDGERTIFAAGNERGIRVQFKARVTELMEQRKVVENRLRDAALGEQTEAAIKRRLHHSLFLKHIRKSPIAHHLGQ